jgi:hypothetical protein
VCVSPSIAGHWFGKHVPAVTNALATTEELLDAVVFYVTRVVSKESRRLELHLSFRETKEESVNWIKALQDCCSCGLLFILVP